MSIPAPTTESTTSVSNNRTVTVTLTRNPPVSQTMLEPPEQRLNLFKKQEQAVQQYYHHREQTQVLFYITSRKTRFVEYKRLQMAYHLNVRDNSSLGQLSLLWQNLYVVDDLVISIVEKMSPQRPVGWQLSSQGMNALNLPTTHPVRVTGEDRVIEHSLASTILQFFGVACFSGDKGYFIGHILGYLFCCYFFAHLNINYGVTPLKEKIALDYPYQWVNVPELVRLLQEVDESLKQKIYQLAVYAAQVSEYAIDKRIEQMLITEVNGFSKRDCRDELASYVLDDGSEADYSALFQPLKPLK